jgi:hypothetical protein
MSVGVFRASANAGSDRLAREEDLVLGMVEQEEGLGVPLQIVVETRRRLDIETGGKSRTRAPRRRREPASATAPPRRPPPEREDQEKNTAAVTRSPYIYGSISGRRSRWPS